jgi:hypothetical protein
MLNHHDSIKMGNIKQRIMFNSYYRIVSLFKLDLPKYVKKALGVFLCIVALFSFIEKEKIELLFRQ